jgi:hypothetical protein
VIQTAHVSAEPDLDAAVGEHADPVDVTQPCVVRGLHRCLAVETRIRQDVADVVEAAWELHGLDVVILRLLRAEEETPPDGGLVVCCYRRFRS